MQEFVPMRKPPDISQYSSKDALVIFGEVFTRGYVNGLIQEAQKQGMKIIYSTVGRRDSDGALRPLTEEEIKEKSQPLINVPLEAGFDLEPDAKGQRPVDQLKGIKLSQWDKVELDMASLEQSRAAGVKRFKTQVAEWLEALKPHLEGVDNLVFAHIMAGGVPRAKIIMPAMNRVFKGYDDRYASSQEFWESPMGQLCDMNFMEVTANTFHHLIEATSELRETKQKSNHKVSYLAYGYHGTEVLCADKYHWQSYSPYLQGFAKLELERISQSFFKDGVFCAVFNCPEILTDSSSIFLGVEVALYPLLGALKKEGPDSPEALDLIKACENKMKDSVSLNDIMKLTDEYLNSDVIKKWTDYPAWPQHNGPEQMKKMREYSTELLNLHKSESDLMTADLSELIFSSCGHLMLNESFSPQQPVWWLGHDIVAQTYVTQESL